MDPREQVLAFLQTSGPSLPYKVAKHLGGDLIMASAYLSELKANGKVRMSNMKVGGGSPLYFLAGQEDQLQQFSDNLGEKQKKVYEMLKERKVLRDTELVPVFRAAIRDTKDFAFPFSVQVNGSPETFWRWYMSPNEETQKLTRQMLGIKPKSAPKIEPPKAEIKRTENEEKHQSEPKPAQQQLTKKPVAKEEAFTGFYAEILAYFKKNNVRIVEETIIRKASEIDFIVDMPSAVGRLRYYVKAKSKKKVNDGDLSAVYVQGQAKRLPALFLAKGELTKKAENMLDSELHGIKFAKIKDGS